MQRRWVPALLALAAALAVAELGVLLLWPRGGVVQPDEVAATGYFDAAQIARAEAYRVPQLPLYGLGLGLELAALALLVARPPRWLRRRAGDRRVLLGVAVTAAALSAGLTLVGLPLGAVSRQRGIDVGLVTRSWPGWAQDVALSAAIQAGLMALTAVALIALMRRAPRWWWVPASAVVTAGAAVLLYVTPVVVDPLFNRFEPLRGAARADVLALAERAGVEVGAVYSIDASRRTTAANAYVAGFGSTKRVVVYDTLLERFTRDEQRLVLAHELAHQHYDDVPRGLLYVLLVAPFALLAVSRLTALWSRSAHVARPPADEGAADSRSPGDGRSTHGARPPANDEAPSRGRGRGCAGLGAKADAGTLPALALALALVVPAVTFVSNQLSRRVEARADTFALQLTDAPAPFVAFERRIAVRNVSRPDPSGPARWLLGTHPTPLERIGAGEAWARGVRP